VLAVPKNLSTRSLGYVGFVNEPGYQQQNLVSGHRCLLPRRDGTERAPWHPADCCGSIFPDPLDDSKCKLSNITLSVMSRVLRA